MGSMREQNQLLAATQDTRQVAPDTREPGAGDFTGPGCAGMSCVWRGVRVQQEKWERLEECEQWPEVSPLVAVALNKPTPGLGDINQVDQMALWCAHTHIPPPIHPVGQCQPCSCTWSKTTRMKEKFILFLISKCPCRLLFQEAQVEQSTFSVYSE